MEGAFDVEVWSNTAGRWLPGKAVRLDAPGEVLVHFEYDGSEMRKRVSFPSKVCRQAPTVAHQAEEAADEAKQAGPASRSLTRAAPSEDVAVSDKVEKGKYRDPEYLIAAVENGGTRLLSGRWLIEFNASRAENEPLKRCQALPNEAFVDPVQLRQWGISTCDIRGRAYIVLALSYCWLTSDNPDPKGQQLGTLSKVVGAMLEDWRFKLCTDIAIFLDFGSLPQNPRTTEEEKRAFQTGLKDVNLWYAHKSTWVLTLTKFPAGWETVTPYGDRGWPSFERLVSSLITDSHMLLDIGFLVDNPKVWGVDFYGLCQRGTVARPGPQSASAFADLLRKLKFANGSDRDFVLKKYEQTLEEVMASADELRFGMLEWGPKEAEHLAEVLPLASSVTNIDLCDNRIGHLGVAALSQAMPNCPSLEKVNIAWNEFGDAGAVAIAQAMPNCPSLKDVYMGNNKIGDAGAVAIAQAMPNCPSLEVVVIEKNDIGDAGAVAMAQALPSCGKLVELHLVWNNIGDAGAMALANALAHCPHLEILRLCQNCISAAGASTLEAAAQAQGKVGISGLRNQRPPRMTFLRPRLA